MRQEKCLPKISYFIVFYVDCLNIRFVIKLKLPLHSKKNRGVFKLLEKICKLQFSVSQSLEK